MKIKEKNYTELISSVFEQILTKGEIVNSRSGETKELSNVVLNLTYPGILREPLLRERFNNPIATVVETMWVLSGSDNIEFLKVFLPRAIEYSDDSKTWKNAYGKRLRDWHGKDQLVEAYKELSSNENTRRCVIGINDPLYCLNEKTKDVACNLVLNFWVRNGELNLTVMSRSMDALWGSLVNFYEWATLQSLFAVWLELDHGSYTHFITSLHLYSDFYEKANSVSEANVNFPDLNLKSIGFNILSNDFNSDISVLNHYLFCVERYVSTGDFINFILKADSIDNVTNWFDLAYLYTAIGFILNSEEYGPYKKIECSLNYLSKIPESADRVSLYSYLIRRFKKEFYEDQENFPAVLKLLEFKNNFSEEEIRAVEWLLGD